MKKILIILFTLSCLTVFAQKRAKNDMEAIMYAGYSASWYSNNNHKASDALQAVTFGLLHDYYFNENWSFRTGFAYQTMGGTSLVYGSNYPADGIEKLGYLNIPLNGNWHFGGNRNWNLDFGFTPSLLLNSKGVYPGITETSVQLQTIRYRFQLGVSAGIGYKIPVSENFSVLVDYQIYHGLTDVTKDDGKTVTNFGYNLNLGGVFKL